MTLPANVTAVMKASGGSAPINLIEILTRSGLSIFISDQQVVANSWLTGADAVTYLPWLVGVPEFHEYRSTKTSTASFNLQNISGNTVARDVATLFSANELTGATVFCRIWRTDAETALYSFLGKLASPEIDEQTLNCSANGFDNWSVIKAPPFRIGETCGLDFGSIECGSTSSTPCNQSYGTCSSIERMKSVIVQWDGAALDYTQVVQPAQTVQMNNQRPF
jgi:hypothetical protein